MNSEKNSTIESVRKVSIFGAGYVGLVTAACFAKFGCEVVCVDIDAHKIARLQAGECPIHEPGLPELLAQNTKAGRLVFTTDLKYAVEHGFYQFIAVGTPSDEDGSADLQYVLAVARAIGEYLDRYCLVITKSTVPVGTSDQVKQAITQQLAQRKVNCVFDVCSNPEFLREGGAINDFVSCDRIIIGTDNETAAEHLRLLYAPFNRNHDRVISMDVRSAELTKYAANAILATKISFINEISNLAERLGADIEQVRVGIGSDPRIGYHFINPGCGYGGSCFPKDVSALIHVATQLNYDAQLIKAVHQVNENQKQILFQKIANYFKQDLRNKTIALWGLAFKPHTDDVRAASSRVLMEALWQGGAHIRAYDPVAMPEIQRIYGNRGDLQLCASTEETLSNADALVIVTEWECFLSPDFEQIKRALRQPVIFDGRNLYDPIFLKSQGFDYFAMGRGRSCEVLT